VLVGLEPALETGQSDAAQLAYVVGGYPASGEEPVGEGAPAPEQFLNLPWRDEVGAACILPALASRGAAVTPRRSLATRTGAGAGDDAGPYVEQEHGPRIGP
jgi:hypothetical protein